MDQIDPRLEEIGRIIRRFNVSVRGLARELGISHTAIYYWIENPSARPHDTSKVDEALSVLRDRYNFPTPAKVPVDKQTSVYYNELPDSAREMMSVKLDMVELRTYVVPVNRSWSAKDVAKRMRFGSAFPGAAGLAVQLEAPLGNIRQGSVLIFKETDYPVPNVYVLASDQSGSESMVIGWIDPNKSGSKLQTADGDEYDLSLWRVTHFAHAVMWGVNESLDDFRYSKTGIGPTSRPQD